MSKFLPSVFLSLGLVCEPAFFHHINKPEVLQELYKGYVTHITDRRSRSSSRHMLFYSLYRESHRLCAELLPVESSFVAPSLDARTHICQLQTLGVKFSCVDKRPYHRRFCPCRAFIKGSVSSCLECLDVL